MPSASWKSKLKRLSKGFKKQDPSSTESPAETLQPQFEAAAANDGSIPAFALAHAPVVWLHKDEGYWPGCAVEHLKHVTPTTFEGEELPVPPEIKGVPAMLASENIKKQGGNVFLTFPDVRNNSQSPFLTSTVGKPDEHGKSVSTCVIVVVDKSELFTSPGTPPDDIWDKDCMGKKVHDVFYFYFYPFNLGNKVLFQNFGNHIGDWEHNMIRFVDGKPLWMHYSAHSDGHCWTWDTLEKSSDGMRPVTYVAGGSHANYPTSGSHSYSPVPILGPKDYTSKGFMWDPLKNWIGAKADIWSQFEALPESVSSLSGYSTDITSDDLLTMMQFEGRWGNSFSQLRKERALSTLAIWSRSKSTKHSKVKVAKDSDEDKKPESDHPHNPIDKLIHKAESDVLAGAGSKLAASIQDGTIKAPGTDVPEATSNAPATTDGPQPDPAEQAAEMMKEEQKASGSTPASLTLYQKLLLLIWAEGPSGPRDKSLGRRMVNRWTEGFLTKLT